MNRRELIKSLPAGALATATLTTESASAQTSTADATGGSPGAAKPKIYKISDTTFSEPGAYDGIQCDQFWIDADGNPIAANLTGTGSDASQKDDDHKMTLTDEEQDILNGGQGEVMAKVLKTVVMHGELFGAERLADCGGAPHSSLYTGSPWVLPVLDMFEEIADAGLKAHAPYTVNPQPENGGEKVDHGSGGMTLLRAA